MTWTHIKPNRDVMLTEQWVLRVNNAPACSLKRDAEPHTWVASLLNADRISAVVLHTTGELEQAQRDCVEELRRMGWRWGVQNEEVKN